MCEYFAEVPDYRAFFGSYPISALLAMALCAHLCGAQRGYRDLAGFAQRFTQAQRRALRIKQNQDRVCPAPSKATFCRLFQAVEADKVEAALLAFQSQIRGPAPKEELVVIDGKEARHSGGAQVVTMVTVPSQYYLASEMVEDKSNEIPAARDMIGRTDLEGRMVSLDALHTQSQTARQLALEAGADYLLTVKDNPKGIRQTLKTLLPQTPAAFPPSA